MILFWAALEIALAVLLATVLGWACCRTMLGDVTWPEKWAWSLAAGLICQSALYGIFLLAHADPGPKKMVVAEMVIAAVLLLLRGAPVGGPRQEPERPRPVSWVFFFGAALAVGVFTLEALCEPMWGGDFPAIWGLKGKMIFFLAAIPARLFHDPFLAFAHPEYPVLLPLILASSSAVVGHWNDQALALLYPFLEIATLAAIFGFLRRRASLPAATVSVFLSAICFGLYQAYLVGNAEIPLAFGIVLVASAFLDSARAASASVNARLALGALACAGLKREGALFALVLASLVLGRGLLSRKKWAAPFLALVVPVIIHGAVLRLLRGPLADRDFDYSLLSLSRLRETAILLFRRELIPCTVPLLLLILFFLLTRRAAGDVLLLPLGVQVAFYAGAPVFSVAGPGWLLETAFARITLGLFPALLLVVGMRLTSVNWGRVPPR